MQLSGFATLRIMEDSMPECQEVQDATVHKLLAFPLQGPSRHGAQFGQIGPISLKPALSGKEAKDTLSVPLF